MAVLGACTVVQESFQGLLSLRGFASQLFHQQLASACSAPSYIECVTPTRKERYDVGTVQADSGLLLSPSLHRLYDAQGMRCSRHQHQ